MNRSALWVGAGCLGCIGVPSLLAIGGAAGYFLAHREEPSFAILDGEAILDVDDEERGVRDDRYDSNELAAVSERATSRENDAWESDSMRVREVETPSPVVKELVREVPVATPAPTPEREIAVARATSAPVVSVSTPAPKPISTPVAKIVAPVATPAAKELARLASPISTPAPVALKKLSAPVVVAAKTAPIPKSTPRNFDDLEFKPAKPAKTTVASAAGASAPSATEEDIAVGDLFGDAPGSTAAPVAAAPAAAVSNAKLRTIKTQGGPVQVTLGKKIAIQGADKKAVLGILEKVEGGWVALRLGDGKVKIIAESDVVDASEL